MTAYPVGTVCRVTEGKFLDPVSDEEALVQHLLIDSRKIVFPEVSLFFAIVGARQDGHDFIENAYRKGVRNFIVSRRQDISKFPDGNFILVENVVTALQKLAAWHRSLFSLPIIGITGSNGKTIVKEWLFQLLREDFNIVRSPKSYNSQIGVPLSVWQINADHTLGIFEAGISKPGEMEKLAPVIDCDTGIFTNIGEAHSEGFISIQQKIKEKLDLFRAAGTIIYRNDDARITDEIENLYPGKRLFTWSKEGNTADLVVEKEEKSGSNTRITAIFRKEKLKLQLPFTDAASIENAIHCWAYLLMQGYKNDDIRDRFFRLEPIAMRLEMKSGINNSLIINDSYNSDISSLKIALDFLEQQSNHRQRTVILSDILQSGQLKESLYKSVAGLLTEKGITRFIGIGDEVKSVESFLNGTSEKYFFENTEAFLKDFDFHKFHNETILLKGARQFAFERIAGRLEQMMHRTILEINLDAIKHNLNVFSEHLQPGVKMMVMVKAAGYGSGSVEIGRLLEFQKVDYLAVAYADEGVELRNAGIDLPVLVLNPEPATFNSIFKYSLEPEIYSLPQLNEFINALDGLEGTIKIHIKLDTGMHRLGFEEQDVEELARKIKNEPRLYVQSVFSHLAASEDPAQDHFTHQQAATFKKLYAKLAEALGYSPLRHILNTSGIIRFPEYQMDMVRLGIGLYGADAPPSISERLEPAMTLKATISQIKKMQPGATVGYGRKGKIEKETSIATISLGYADGLLRAAGNGKYSVLIRGKRAPIVGNVCMDMTMVDVSGIPDVAEGDEVIVFGRVPRAEELAAAFGTIPYEVFTNIAGRVKRVYFQEG